MRTLVPFLLLGAAVPAALATAGAPVPRGFIRPSEVTPGMDVTAYTVFAGTEVEPFHGKVLGVSRNFFGPSRDIVLVDFDEERVRHSGIVHGMSGSPVYVGDRLLGAVSLVLSPFPKDAVAGVTPIEYMLAEGDRSPGGPPPREGRLHAPRPAPEPLGARPAMLRPIGTPLTFAGVRPEVFAHYRPQFEALGLAPVLGAGGVDLDAALGPEALQPGSVVSAVLATGDLTLDASGTVTYRDGDRIYAFGHPFLGQGEVAIPMAAAAVVTTLADQTFSYKVTNAGPPVGTISFDRMTAIVGEVGPVPGTIPMRVRVSKEGSEVAEYNYRLARNPWLTPLVFQVLAANSLAFRWDYDEEATYRLRATIQLAGRSPVMIQETYTVAPDPRSASAFAIAGDVGGLFAALYMNPYTPVEIEGIDLRFDTVGRGLIDRLEGVFVDPERLRAGESAGIKVAIRGLRGPRRLVSLSLPIPTWAGGRRFALRVADSNTLRLETALTGSPLERASSLDQLVELLTSRPRADRLYVQLLAFSPDAILYHKRLPSLPGSVVEVLERSGGPYRRVPRALIWETTIPTDGIAVGTQELLLEVRP